MKLSIRNVLVFVVLALVAIAVTSCVDYRSADEEATTEDVDLTAEIADLEAQLAEGETAAAETSEEESSSEEVEAISVTESENAIRIVVNENELVELGTEIIDADGDDVTYEFSAPLSRTGVWQSNYGDAGEYLITLTATDGVHETAQDVLLVVNRVNVPPTITPVTDQQYQEGDLITFEPAVVDPNGDGVSVRVSEPLSQGSWQTDHTSAGVYEVTVVAGDGELQSQTSFTLTINDVNEVPVLSNIERRIVVQEGEEVQIAPQVSDLDADEITVTISDPVGDDGLWQTGYTDHGQYNIVVRVSDGKDTITENVELIVEDVNVPPQIIDVSLENR